ncbi:restriction endonuclease subunit S [Psychrobacter faecalis]|uniref:Restriction endonuclease subunit S n=1 Tax=Psychrobacter faecalis TaxID=180588 RepID=A0ABT9HG42_9GAMM|nr:restriction endonuclease subunit S [Psychrobacter faecalis]MDP4544735.1 restriction endonuclease subunit S [Psychrobacter faecalis]
MTVKTSLEISNDISKPEQLITEHIDIWTSAILAKSTSGRGSSKKYELYGITKLRELILELAVRGKLVPQDDNDEPASVLLEKIAAEKAQLIKEKKIKKTKADSEVSEDEKFFELPNSWQWTRLNLITEINPRNTDVDDKTKASFVPMTLITTSYDGVHDSESRPWSEIKKGYTHFANGDIAIAKITPCFENSKAAIFRNLENGIGAGTTELHVARPFGDQIESNFLLLYFKSPNFLTMGQKLMTGSAGHKRVPRSFFESNPIPLPPLAEQKRIVAKVDELMLLCDQLEQQTEASIEAHATLVEVLLATLTDSAGADELAQNWRRIAEHFDSLFTTEQSIEALKKTVLQLAVMGKLVPQNPEDETASVLLEKIAEEKERLIKDKVIKKEKPLPAITDDEKPFELQTGWVWGRVNDIAHLKGGFAYKSKEFLDVGTYQVIRMGNIRPDNLRLDKNSVYIPEGLAESTQDYRINTGDILLTMTGTNGKEDYLYSLVVLDTHLLDQQLYLNQRLCRLRPILMNVDFLNIALKEPQLKKPIFNQSTGSANQANIGMGVISHWVLPVPPLAEQHRIVSKVDELMAICDQLKQKLKQSQETQVQLTDALIDRALG